MPELRASAAPLRPAAALSRRSRAALSVPAAVMAVAAVAGCGGSSHAAASAGAAVTSAAATGTASPASAAAGTSGGTGGFAAYAACLKQHGVTMPTARPDGAARGSGVPGGGFYGGLNATSGPAAAAAKACESLRPTGGFGGGANSSAIASELTAYRSCLSDHGVVLPTPAARPSATPAAGAAAGSRRGLGGLGALDMTDPKVAAAAKACAALRPSFGGPAGAGGTPVPTTTPSS